MQIHISLILCRKYSQRENISVSCYHNWSHQFFLRLSPHPKSGSSLSEYNAPSDDLKWPNVDWIVMYVIDMDIMLFSLRRKHIRLPNRSNCHAEWLRSSVAHLQDFWWHHWYSLLPDALPNSHAVDVFVIMFFYGLVRQHVFLSPFTEPSNQFLLHYIPWDTFTNKFIKVLLTLFDLQRWPMIDLENPQEYSMSSSATSAWCLVVITAVELNCWQTYSSWDISFRNSW